MSKTSYGILVHIGKTIGHIVTLRPSRDSRKNDSGNRHESLLHYARLPSVFGRFNRFHKGYRQQEST
ncbi:hypothetical protein P152DRAFT_262454 [Eremomyces bilateralis CBS 781.70]|uniref:Uncharacterized protein n=1 Tax=Eremomyces bilateralis CBS 781.70 TaxID=1392243 RepID=A0A6G1G7Z3_9PEZI|nr:uncharacterized protein P152DRAFT_262454 [Eremomyces bilateralis CBS 781.70]KAF1814153.1 hypothetical protein P152DRAFT_262454 [Eremomyces bilateralis CBS 781.70]